MKTTAPHLCPYSDYDRIFPGDTEWEKCQCEEGGECRQEHHIMDHCMCFLMREVKKLNETIEKIRGNTHA